MSPEARRRLGSGVADALGIVRLVAAFALPSVLVDAVNAGSGSWAPFGLFAIAAATDFLDGIIARRVGVPTRHGALVDTAADVAFVLAGTGTAAALGMVSVLVPVAIVVAVASYAAASMPRRDADGGWRLARSRLGHAAGVCNYALTALVGGAVALPWRGWDTVLALAGAGVVGLNLAAVLHRLVAGVSLPAPAPPGAGTRAR